MNTDRTKPGVRLHNLILAEAKDCINDIVCWPRRVEVELMTGARLIITQHELQTRGGMLHAQTDSPTWNIKFEDPYGEQAERVPITPAGQNYESDVSTNDVLDKIHDYSVYIQTFLFDGDRSAPTAGLPTG
jgi:hypothetical protein